MIEAETVVPVEHSGNNNNNNGNNSSASTPWKVCGEKLPKAEIVYFCQIIILYAIIITCVVNISLGRSDELWRILLTSCIGYILPSPALKNRKLLQNGQ